MSNLNLDALAPLIAAAQSDFASEEAQVSSDQTTIAGLNAQISAQAAQITSLTQQLAAAAKNALSSILAASAMLWLVVRDIQQAFTWVVPPGNVGDSGGGNTKPSGTETITYGKVTTMLWTPGYAYNNSYQYARLDALPNIGDATQWVQDYFVQFPATADVTDEQCYETEVQIVHRKDGLTYNAALQWRKSDGQVYVFDFTGKAGVGKGWMPTGIFFGQPVAGVWYHIRYESHIDETNHQIVADAVEFQGKRSVFTNMIRPGVAMHQSGYAHYAIQEDATSAATPGSIQVTDVDFLYR